LKLGSGGMDSRFPNGKTRVEKLLLFHFVSIPTQQFIGTSASTSTGFDNVDAQSTMPMVEHGDDDDADPLHLRFLTFCKVYAPNERKHFKVSVFLT
jgi:hypothetical protein